jgi:hypothetical protein
VNESSSCPYSPKCLVPMCQRPPGGIMKVAQPVEKTRVSRKELNSYVRGSEQGTGSPLRRSAPEGRPGCTKGTARPRLRRSQADSRPRARARGLNPGSRRAKCCLLRYPLRHRGSDGSRRQQGSSTRRTSAWPTNPIPRASVRTRKARLPFGSFPRCLVNNAERALHRLRPAEQRCRQPHHATRYHDSTQGSTGEVASERPTHRISLPRRAMNEDSGKLVRASLAA